MARLRARHKKGNIIVRISYWISRLKTGKIAKPVAIRAHHPWVMMSYGTFELMVERAHKLDKKLAIFASTRVAGMIGCHW